MRNLLAGFHGLVNQPYELNDLVDPKRDIDKWLNAPRVVRHDRSTLTDALNPA